MLVQRVERRALRIHDPVEVGGTGSRIAACTTCPALPAFAGEGARATLAFLAVSEKSPFISAVSNVSPG